MTLALLSILHRTEYRYRQPVCLDPHCLAPRPRERCESDSFWLGGEFEKEHAMRPKADIEIFVNGWVAQNVRSVSGAANLAYEVDRLAARLTGDARAQGISGSDLHRAVGDIDDYLTKRCHREAGPPSDG